MPKPGENKSKAFVEFYLVEDAKHLDQIGRIYYKDKSFICRLL